jgi:GNAT superfamily N-acetyltransferase
MQFRFSDIETARFKVRSGRCDAYRAEDRDQLWAEIEAHRCDLVTIRCDAAQLSAARQLTDAGAFLADTIVTMETSAALGADGGSTLAFTIDVAGPADEQDLSWLARDAFSDYVNHYRADPHLDDAAVTDAMVEWSTSFLKSTPARGALIARKDHSPLGYACMALEADTAMGVLHGVAKHWRKQGVYEQLLRAGMAWGAAHGATRMTVATQLHNLATQRTMAKLGMRVCSAEYTFHLWPRLTRHGAGLPIKE